MIVSPGSSQMSMVPCLVFLEIHYGRSWVSLEACGGDPSV